MEKEKIEKTQEDINKIERKRRVVYSHLQQLYYIRSRLQKPKGIFFKRCPICGEKLVEDSVYFKYFHCECGYEFYDPSQSYSD